MYHRQPAFSPTCLNGVLIGLARVTPSLRLASRAWPCDHGGSTFWTGWWPRDTLMTPISSMAIATAPVSVACTMDVILRPVSLAGTPGRGLRSRPTGSSYSLFRVCESMSSRLSRSRSRSTTTTPTSYLSSLLWNYDGDGGLLPQPGGSASSSPVGGGGRDENKKALFLQGTEGMLQHESNVPGYPIP